MPRIKILKEICCIVLASSVVGKKIPIEKEKYSKEPTKLARKSKSFQNSPKNDWRTDIP